MPLNSIDLLMIASLWVWIFLYLFHSDYSGGLGKAWWGGYLITTNFWFFIGYYTLKSYSCWYSFSNARFVTVIINTLKWFLSFFFLIELVDMVVQLPIHENIQYNNGLAIISSFCILLILFFPHTKSMSQQIQIFFICTFVIVYSESRAAIMVICLLIIYKFYSLIKSKKRRLLLKILFPLLLLIVIKTYYVDLVSQYNAYFSGLDLFGTSIPNGEGWGRKNKLVSAASRIQSNILLFREFIESPYFGSGYQHTMTVRSFGVISHTYYLFPLASYGIIGITPYLLMFLVTFYRGFKRNRVGTIATIIYLISVFTFLNDMVAWLAIVFFLIQSRPEVNMSNLLPQQQKKQKQITQI
jgi:hypothetical protein